MPAARGGRRASALGFGVGLGFKRVPAALVEAARERDFPVFAVPYETPFREIIHFVDSALTSGEEHVFRRLTALQRYLVDALRTPQPERAMVDRLARFLDASVLLLGRRRRARDRRRQGARGRAAARGVRAAAGPGRARGRRLARGRAGGHAAVGPRRLVLASPRRGFVGKLAKPAAEATAPLLAAMARLSDVVRDQELAVKAALLEEALEPVGPRPAPLAARAAAFGLDFSQPAGWWSIRSRLGVRRSGRPRSSRPSPAPRSTAATALTVLVQGDVDVRAAVALADASPTVAIGIGRRSPAIVDAHHSLRDAELAVDRGGRARGFEDFDLGTFMVSERSRPSGST